MRRNTLLLIGLVVVAMLAAAFWWIDFRAATSETRNSSQVSTGSTETAVEAWQAATNRKIAIYVAGTDDLATALRQKLTRDLNSGPAFQEVVLLDEPVETADGSLLLIEVEERDVTWTPVYAQARLKATITFSSLGDLYWRQGTAMVFYSDRPTIAVRGDFQLDDSTRGLVSRKSYERVLGEQIAAEITKSLEKALAPQT
jgi:hypothetical protein